MEIFALLSLRTLTQKQAALPLIAYTVSMTLLLTILGGAFAFTRWNPGLEEDFLAFYKLLATVAVCLLIVPLFSLGASTARLSARTREDRLCTLSLLGMKPAQVRLQAIGEALLYALVGTVLGWLLNFVTVIPFSALTFQDVPLGYRNMLLPFPYQCAVVMGLLLLALLSSLVGMGKLTITPLEIRFRASLPPQGKLAAGIGILVLLVALAISVGGSLGMAGASMVLILLFALGPLVLGLIALDLLGGFLLSIYAKVRVAHVRPPEQLLGYRGLQESARTIWRQISGVAFTTFISVILGIGISMSGNASETLPREEILLGDDIRTGVVLTLAICFILVALSAALNQVSHIYERAVLFSSLQMMGVPTQTLQKSRRTVLFGPLVLTSLLSAGTAFVLVLPLLGGGLLSAQGALATLGGLTTAIGGGLLLVYLSLRATGTTLTRIAEKPTTAI